MNTEVKIIPYVYKWIEEILIPGMESEKARLDALQQPTNHFAALIKQAYARLKEAE